MDNGQLRAHCLSTFARSRVLTKKVNTADRSLTHWPRHEIRRVTTQAAADPRDDVSEQRRLKHNWGTTTTCSFRSFALPPPPPRRVEEKERTRARELQPRAPVAAAEPAAAGGRRHAPSYVTMRPLRATQPPPGDPGPDARDGGADGSAPRHSHGRFRKYSQSPPTRPLPLALICRSPRRWR